MTERFDYVVLGGGSGGIASARRAASYGAKVALVEPGRLGGTCVNVGCVPKKVMYNAAALAQALRETEAYGFDVDVRGFDWAALKQRRDAYLARLNGIYAKNLAQDRVVHIRGSGRLSGPGEVDVAGRRVLSEHVLLATGGRPRLPDIVGAELGITSDGFFELERRPERVAVVGAGYIAVEMAGILNGLGARVTLATRNDEFLRGFDGSVRRALMTEMTEQGVEIVPCEEVARVDVAPDGMLGLTTRTGRVLAGFDCILWAIGREPRTAGLGFEECGVTLGPEGHVLVDGFQNTSLRNVYAVGDVTGRKELTPVAIAAGRRLADRLFGGQPEACLVYEDIPSVIFSDPPIGTVGLSEEQAREQYGDSVKVYTSQYTNIHYALTERRPKSFVKLVTVLPEEKIVGIHIVGLGSDEVIQGFAVALRMGARKADLDRTVAIHPTAAEELVTLK